MKLRTCFSLIILFCLTGCEIPGQPLTPVPAEEQTLAVSGVTPLVETLRPMEANETIFPEATAVVAQVAPRESGGLGVWLINPAEPALLGVDPAVNDVFAHIRLSADPGGVAVGEGAVWLYQSKPGETFITRIDPYTGQETARQTFLEGGVRCIAAGTGGVWACLSRAQGKGIANLARLAPQGDTIIGLYPLRAQPFQVAVDESGVWVLQTMDVFTLLGHVNPGQMVNDTLPRSVPSAEYVHQFARFAVHPSGIYTISQDRQSHYIYRVDPQDGRVLQAIDVAPEGDYPLDLAATGDSIWVALHSGDVVRVDAATLTVTALARTGAALTELIVAENTIWAHSPLEARLYRIDPVGGQLVAQIETGRRLQPTATPVPKLPPGEVCQGSYPTQFRLGDFAEVNPSPPIPNRVRVEPNLHAKILGEIGPYTRMQLIEGPVCTDGWVWWKIKVENSDLTGWTAEGDGENYWLIPIPY